MEELDINDVVVKTASGGLHIYCNEDFFSLTSNRMVKCYASNDFDVDIFSCHDPTKMSIAVIPPSRVRANHNSSVSNYSFIRGSFDSCITRSINDILKSLKIKITTDKSDDIKTISTETPHVSNTTTDEFIHALLDGLYDLEVHNDVGSMPTEKETTRFTVVQALQ